MEYKGMTVRQTKNGNISVVRNDGAMFIVSTSSKKYMNDEDLKKLVDQRLNYLQKE